MHAWRATRIATHYTDPVRNQQHHQPASQQLTNQLTHMPCIQHRECKRVITSQRLQTHLKRK